MILTCIKGWQTWPLHATPGEIEEEMDERLSLPLLFSTRDEESRFRRGPLHPSPARHLTVNFLTAFL